MLEYICHVLFQDLVKVDEIPTEMLGKVVGHEIGAMSPAGGGMLRGRSWWRERGEGR